MFNLYNSLETKALEAATTKHGLTTRSRNPIHPGAVFVIISFRYIIIIRTHTMIYICTVFLNSHAVIQRLNISKTNSILSHSEISTRKIMVSIYI